MREKDRISCKLDPERFDNFTFSRRSHWNFFTGCDRKLYGKNIALDKCTLKFYQDLLVYKFIKDNIASGARILDVGGGDSRILKHFAGSYDCWNVDKLEGLGNGPRQVERFPYKMVYDYMGNFNSHLPDNSFDFVFSISALEHTPQKVELFDNIIKDIDRVLKPGGFSLHLFDVRFTKNGEMWSNRFVYRIFDTVETINKFVPPETVEDDPDLYFMNEAVYHKTWFYITRIPYAQFGRPVSLNILWRKPSKRDEKFSK